jgi:PPOX class probable F420-dependent enzyme
MAGRGPRVTDHEAAATEYRRGSSGMTPDMLWDIVAGGRNGILATIDEDGTPHLSNIYYLSDRSRQCIRFSTMTTRRKGRNLLRDPRGTLHVPGHDFFNFAVVTGVASLRIAREEDTGALDELYAIHSGLGAASIRDGFDETMVANHRMAVELAVTRLYGQILDR